MSEILYLRIFLRSKLKSNSVYLFLIILIIQIKSAFFYIQNACKYNKSYLNESCFNDKIEFHDNYRAGHFETFKDGSLVVEYSIHSIDNYKINDKKRLFYGLKKMGDIIFLKNHLLNLLKLIIL